MLFTFPKASWIAASIGETATSAASTGSSSLSFISFDTCFAIRGIFSSSSINKSIGCLYFPSLPLLSTSLLKTSATLFIASSLASYSTFGLGKAHSQTKGMAPTPSDDSPALFSTKTLAMRDVDSLTTTLPNFNGTLRS